MYIFGSAADPNQDYGPNRTQCPKCHGARSGMRLHETATALAGRPIFTWEYCPVCGGTGWIHKQPLVKLGQGDYEKHYYFSDD